MVERIKLSNGVEIAFKRTPHLRTSSLGIWIKTGSRFEDGNLMGVAHFLEHMVFKGSQKYSSRKIKEFLEGRGGSINAFTSQEVTAFYGKILDKNLPLAFDVLFDMVFNPLLLNKDLEQERKVILEEIKMYNDMPSSRVISLLDNISWGDTPLGRDIIGEEKTVMSMTKDDLEKFSKKFYRGSNILVVFNCSFDPKNIIKIIERKCSVLPSGEQSKVNKVKFLAKPEYKIEESNFNQTHLALAFGEFNYFSPQRMAINVLNTIIGANMSSRLFEVLREKKGLAYDVGSSIKLYKDTGAFVIHIGLDQKNVIFAYKLILKELEKIKNMLVTQKELKMAKEYLLGNLLMSLESPVNFMFYVGESICSIDKVYDLEYIEKKIMSVSREYVLEVADKIFDLNKIKVSLVTDKNDNFGQSFKDIISSLN